MRSAGTGTDEGRAFGFLWAGVAVVLLALAPFAPALAEVAPPCLFRSVIGIPCPACGSVRSALALSRLEVRDAVALNPLAAAAWIALVAGGLWSGWRALRRRPVWLPPARISLAARVLLVAVVLVNWVYLVRSGR